MKKILLIVCMTFYSTLSYADIATGLVGWWKFDEGTGTSTTADSSGNGSTGNLQNSPTWVSGKIGPYALSFNGSNQYVDMGQPSSLNISGGAVTLSAWINPGLSSQNGGIVAKDNNTVNTQYLMIQFGSKIEFRISTNNGNFVFDSNTNLSSGKWYFATGVYNGSNMYIYLNGVQDNILSATGNVISIASDVTIGAHGGGSTNPFNGSIDDVRIYNRALSQADVTELYNVQSTIHLNNVHLVNFHS